jgi:crossover junction endodeoxyribonuclease RuvC
MERTRNARGFYVGIDPGSASGGLAIIESGYRSTACNRFKDMTQKELCNIIRGWQSYPTFVIIEQVHTMPHQGIVSAGKFMENFGMLKGFLMALDIPFKAIRPQVWQKWYSMHKEKTETQSEWKKRLRQRAQELFPTTHIRAEEADALLLANYCMCCYNEV